MLGCVIGSVGMAGMPYPPNLCASVPICGRLSLPEGSVCSACSVGHSPHLLCWCCRGSCASVVVFSHGFHGFPQMVRLCYWRRGYGRMPYPPNQCASVSICGRHFSARRFCVFRVFCGEFVHCFVGAALLVHLRQVHPLRVPPESASSAIGLRPPPDQIPFAVRSDSVRHPIRFRPLHDAISSVCTLRRLHFNIPHVPLLHPFMFAKLRNKFDF